jgi:transposase
VDRLDEEAKGWSELWQRGLSVKIMGSQLGCSSVKVIRRVCFFRRKGYESLFPTRLNIYDHQPVPSRLRQWWNRGLSCEAIADKCAVSLSQVKRWLTLSRRMHGLEAFPHHNQVRDEFSQQPGEATKAYLQRLRLLLDPVKQGWDNWVAVPTLAKQIGIKTNRLYSLIVVARSRLGWFPHRGSEERDKSFKQYLRRELAPARKLWASGQSTPKIAAALQLSNASLIKKITRARQLLGHEWFPRRQPSRVDRQAMWEDASKLWRRGASVEFIAAKLGVKTHSLTMRIYNHRRRFGEAAFPYRKPRSTGG